MTFKYLCCSECTLCSTESWIHFRVYLLTYCVWILGFHAFGLMQTEKTVCHSYASVERQVVVLVCMISLDFLHNPLLQNLSKNTLFK